MEDVQMPHLLFILQFKFCGRSQGLPHDQLIRMKMGAVSHQARHAILDMQLSSPIETGGVGVVLAYSEEQLRSSQSLMRMDVEMESLTGLCAA